MVTRFTVREIPYIIEVMQPQALIVLVEDSEHDVNLVRRTFAKAQVAEPIHVVKSAEEAMAFLENRPPYTDRVKNPMPALIMLDLTLPGMDGFELLKWIRVQTKFDRVYIVVLTASLNPQDVRHAYELGANSFLNKPLELANVGSLLAATRRPLRWLKTQAEAVPKESA